MRKNPVSMMLQRFADAVPEMLGRKEQTMCMVIPIIFMRL